MATCGNGAGIGIRAVIIVAVRAVTLRDLLRVPTASAGAVIGASMPSSVGLRIAATTARTTASTATDSGFRGRLDAHRYLLAGVGRKLPFSLLTFLPFARHEVTKKKRDRQAAKRAVADPENFYVDLWVLGL